MKSHITVITLGVDDLERAYTFYKDGLGLPSKGIIGKEFEHGAVAFFDLYAKSDNGDMRFHVFVSAERQAQ